MRFSNIVTLIKNWKCRCGKKFTSKDFLIEHITHQHPGAMYVDFLEKCDECDENEGFEEFNNNQTRKKRYS